MPDYDFGILSPVELERLVRDLLQAEWEVTLESFTSGRDKGIDLRHSRGDGALIVQCKQYAGSGFRKLLSHLKTEVPKVKALKPKRYCVATSVGLSPDNKDAICRLFAPFCQGPSDVFGRDDLNNLLGKFSEIEKANPKLWLSSVSVLQRVLHADVFARSQVASATIPDTLRLYVQNESFGVAQEILKALHYCVIAGIPGIGKTTLAEMLAADFAARGFQFVRVGGDVSEALRVFDPTKPQFFLYDDFLGQTALSTKMRKNEEVDLLDLLDLARRSESTRVVLTTREYILNQAKDTYERLATSDFDWRRCTIGLESYTRLHRAEILANHLFFSGLPAAYIDALIDGRAYERIVDHPNYSPRVVQWMTMQFNPSRLPPAQYAHAFVAALDNPERLWAHAFEQQLSEPARNLLLVLTTLPPVVLLGDLELAFHAFHDLRAQRHRSATSPGDFQKALRETDGNFISTAKPQHGRNELIARFHNPSIRDYLEARLASSPGDVEDLLASAVAFEQPVYLFRRQFAGANSPTLWEAFRRTFDAPPAALSSSVELFATRVQLDLAQRAATAIKGRPRPVDTAGAATALREMLETVQSGTASFLVPHSLDSLLDSLRMSTDVSGLVEEGFYKSASAYFSARLRGLDAFHYLLRIRSRTPNAVSDAQLNEARERFPEAIDQDTASLVSDVETTTSDALQEYRSRLHSVADELEVELDPEWVGEVEQAIELAQESEDLADARAEHEADMHLDEFRSERGDVRDVSEVFDALRHARA